MAAAMVPKVTFWGKGDVLGNEPPRFAPPIAGGGYFATRQHAWPHEPDLITRHQPKLRNSTGRATLNRRQN
jgi:hypothetical protein